MAYVREQQIRKGDKTYRYYQLVRGYRENGKVKIEVLKHLGPFGSKAEAQAASEAERLDSVVTKADQASERDNPFYRISPDILNAEDAVLHKMRRRLRAAARRRSLRVEDAQAEAALWGYVLTEEDWGKVEEILQEVEDLTHDADVLSEVLKHRRLSVGS